MHKCLILVFSIACFTSSISLHAQSILSAPCLNNPEVRDDFSDSKPYFHEYTVESVVCNSYEFKNVSQKLIYDILLKHACYVAPTFNTEQVVNCNQILANISAVLFDDNFTGNDPILQVVFPANYSVTNYTMPGHVLHAGKVVRQIVQVADNFIIRTTGTGNNSDKIRQLANGNEFLMEKLWKAVDEKFITDARKIISDSHQPSAHLNEYKSPKNLFIMKEFKLDAKLSEPFDTNIKVNEDDYVYIEAEGEINLGRFAGTTSANGLINPLFNGFNKYKGRRHGCLLYMIDEELGGCESISEKLENKDMMQEYADNEILMGLSIINRTYGTYFIAGTSGNIVLDINDTKTTDNSGHFSMRIFVMSREAHLKRNFFNRCPDKMSKVFHKPGWEQEKPELSAFYHGLDNYSFRGTGFDNRGCQCVYDKITGDPAPEEVQGSYDIGYKLYGNPPYQNGSKFYLHLVLDVIPHDLFTSKYGTVYYINQ